MYITKARLSGFTKSIPNGIRYLFRSFKDKRFKLEERFQIVFRDITFTKYDWQGELTSLRGGISTLNKWLGIKPVTIDQFLMHVKLAPPKDQTNYSGLADLFRQYGSDKSTKNDLHLVYGPLLEFFKKENEVRVLEIGLGTNNVGIPSNMGSTGKPGASLFAFRSYLGTRGKIFGADVDTNVLFEAEMIQTFYVDQLDIVSLIQLGTKSKDFHLIIDDGLHTFEANINTFMTLLPKLNKNGIIVIEDIAPLPENLILWSMVSDKILKEGMLSSLVKTSTSMVFIAIRN
jgi:hypothetical protein